MGKKERRERREEATMAPFNIIHGKLSFIVVVVIADGHPYIDR